MVSSSVYCYHISLDSNDTIYNVIFRRYAQGLQKLDLTKTEQFVEQVESMSEQEILEADTGSHVFLALSGTILDAMEDFKTVLTIGGAA